MTLLIARSPLTEAVKTTLNAVLSAESGAVPRFDVGRAPDNPPKDRQERLVHGYGLIWPLVSPIMWGSLANPEDVLTAVYQISLVGRSPEHVQNLSDATHRALLDRDSAGVFVNAITVAGLTVVERRCAARGTVTESPGALWEVPDIYELEAQAV